jgi:hypothetical protein
MVTGAAEREGIVPAKSSAWTDLGLTLPIFVVYHLGVMFLPVRNAADVVTQELVVLAHHDRIAYAALTVGLGALFVAALLMLGRGDKLLRWQSFAWLALEGIVYAIAMKLVAAAVVGELFLATGFLGAGVEGRFTGFIMSLGAGLYEEVAFRVVLFGLGLACLRVLLRPKSAFQRWSLAIGWAVVCALVFSAWHHVGAYGDALDARVFVFRAVCALVFTLIYTTRGFAPTVWTHVSYDVWVLAF